MMEEQQIKLVEDSFRKIGLQGDAFTKRFYEQLFAKHQDIAAQFAETDMGAQRRKLLLMMMMVVDHLRDSAYLNRSLKDLTTQHLEMAVTSDQYRRMNGLFIDTLAEFMPDEWNDVYRIAWERAFDKITAHMLGQA